MAIEWLLSQVLFFCTTRSNDNKLDFYQGTSTQILEFSRQSFACSRCLFVAVVAGEVEVVAGVVAAVEVVVEVEEVAEVDFSSETLVLLNML